jgi:hypothetical protein
MDTFPLPVILTSLGVPVSNNGAMVLHNMASPPDNHLMWLHLCAVFSNVIFVHPGVKTPLAIKA